MGKYFRNTEVLQSTSLPPAHEERLHFAKKVTVPFESRSKIKIHIESIEQGSLLGPAFWKVLIDGLIRIAVPEGINLVDSTAAILDLDTA